jgi:DNA-binding NarL/FixJ family response regulator
MTPKVHIHCQSPWFKAAAEAQLASLELSRPLILVLDQPVGFALQALPMLEPPYVVVTLSQSDYYLRDLIEFKPSALLLEPISPERLTQVLKLVAQGERIAYPELSGNTLTPRERQVVRLLLKGLGDKEIASSLRVETKTAQHWMASIRQKMMVENRSQVILEYFGLSLTG